MIEPTEDADLDVDVDVDVETMRRAMTATVNASAATRDELAAAHGAVWDTAELQREFEVLGFAAPFVVVRRWADGRKGSLMFQHDPRFYFAFHPDDASTRPNPMEGRSAGA
ncbi:MAG TPA: hypothetical protein VH475_20010 [Tepidisphaeraceae bacterium]|jgi:hypothetical protein